MGSYQSWFNRDKGHFWQKITEIGRTAARLSPCDPARSEEGLRDQAFPRWKEGARPPPLPISVIFCHGGAPHASNRCRQRPDRIAACGAFRRFGRPRLSDDELPPISWAREMGGGSSGEDPSKTPS